MKIPPKLESHDIVEITWIDATSPSQTTWIQRDDIDSPIMTIKSLGYYLGEQDGYIRIAADMSVSDDYVDQIARLFAIPKGCVKRIRKIK